MAGDVADESGNAGDLYGGPPPVLLAGQERPDTAGVVDVATVGRAVPGAAARQCIDPGACPGAGDLDGGAPAAVPLARNERMAVVGAVQVPAAGCAVPGARARHRGDLGVSSGV